MKEETILFVPDLQISHHDPQFVTKMIDFMKDMKPTTIIMIGDIVDCTAPARWNRGSSLEFAGTLQAEFDEFSRIACEIRSSFDGPIQFHLGNHEKRIARYIESNAPAFGSLRSLKISELLEFNEHGIEEVGEFYQFAPGWLSTHGDVGGSLSRNAGSTALSIARNTGYSIVCGHTHRQGIVSESRGYAGNLKVITGVEVGHGMDETKASYMKGGVMNWQKGLAYAMVRGDKVLPGLVPYESL